MPSNAPDVNAIAELAARIFSRSVRPQVQRVEEGVSTYVYRIRRADEVCYLRVLPEADASFAPEVYAHQRLRERGVNVPEVLYFEHCNQALGRSVMVTTEIKGASLARCNDAQAQRHILRAAGRDLAVINSLPVRGFGWIKRSRSKVTRLEAEHSTSRAFLTEYLERDLAALAEAHVLKQDTLATIQRILKDYDTWLASQHSWLAHGDFDVTHMYQEAGHYTGIIDFGEIRGADFFYDLGHFSMHDGETLPILVLPWLLEGYQEIAPLPDGYRQHIAFASLLIAIRTLARAGQKRPQTLPTHHGLQAIPRDIRLLLG
ncbi:MAG TPA: aminoglycoside phosphotransferase family protein [Ktedonobacterales bacterium]|jgi:aminoglycoside phosphotransferase (APT) family kinase protein